MFYFYQNRNSGYTPKADVKKIYSARKMDSTQQYTKESLIPSLIKGGKKDKGEVRRLPTKKNPGQRKKLRQKLTGKKEKF